MCEPVTTGSSSAASNQRLRSSSLEPRGESTSNQRLRSSSLEPRGESTSCVLALAVQASWAIRSASMSSGEMGRSSSIAAGWKANSKVLATRGSTLLPGSTAMGARASFGNSKAWRSRHGIWWFEISLPTSFVARTLPVGVARTRPAMVTRCFSGRGLEWRRAHASRGPITAFILGGDAAGYRQPVIDVTPLPFPSGSGA